MIREIFQFNFGQKIKANIQIIFIGNILPTHRFHFNSSKYSTRKLSLFKRKKFDNRLNLCIMKVISHRGIYHIGNLLSVVRLAAGFSNCDEKKYLDDNLRNYYRYWGKHIVYGLFFLIS